MEAARLLEIAWARLPERAVEKAWIFHEDERVNSLSQCIDLFNEVGMGQEGLDEEPSNDGGLFTIQHYREIRELEQAEVDDSSANEESEPGSSDTTASQVRRIELARERAISKRLDALDVLEVEAFFDSLPTFDPSWRGRSEKPRAFKDALVAKTRLKSHMYDAPINVGPFARRYDKPDPPFDPQGWVFRRPPPCARAGEADC